MVFQVAPRLAQKQISCGTNIEFHGELLSLDSDGTSNLDEMALIVNSGTVLTSICRIILVFTVFLS